MLAATFRKRMLWIALLTPCAIGAEDASPPASSEKPPDPSKETPPPAKHLPEIVVTATRGERAIFDLPRTSTVVTQEQVRQKNPRTPAEVLEAEPGVFIQRTGHRGGAPIIRGLIGKFVLPMVDGVRLQGGDSFSGPNALLNSVDPNMIDRIEVLEGPSSMLYGSDAMGGVVHVLTKRNTSFPEKFEYGGELRSRYGSVDEESMGHLRLFGGKAPFNFLLGYTKQEVGDSVGGDGLGTLLNTSWKEEDVSAQIGFRPSPGNTWSFRYASVLRTDVTRFDKPWDTPTLDKWWTSHSELFKTSAGLRSNAWINPFIRTEIAAVEYQGESPTSFWEDVQIQASFRRESQSQIQRSEPSTTTVRDDWTDSDKAFWSFSPRFMSRVGDRHRLTYGLDYRFESIPSGNKTRFTLNKTTGGTSELSQIPSTPDATYEDIGLYLQDEARIGEKWTFLYGGRYTQNRLVSRPTRDTTPSGVTVEGLTIDESDEALTWSAGTVYAATPDLRFSANVATAFRSPSNSDMLSTGAFTSGVNSPSTGLSPEESITYEAGMKYEDDRTRGGLTYSWTDIKNMIVSKQGTFNGSDFVDLNGDGVKQSTEQVFVKTNANSAFVYTIEGNLTHKTWRGLTLLGTSATLSPFVRGGYSLGKDRTDDIYINFIPPLHADYGLRMETDSDEESSRHAFVELLAHSVRHQDRITKDTDSQMKLYGASSTELPGYTVYHLSTGYSWNDRWDVTLAFRNLTNKYYQEVFSRLPADGFSTVLSVGMKF